MQPTNLEELYDAIITTWTQIPKGCFQNIVESMPRRTDVILNAKGEGRFNPILEEYT